MLCVSVHSTTKINGLETQQLKIEKRDKSGLNSQIHFIFSAFYNYDLKNGGDTVLTDMGG
jgi:hypothetical protein